MVEPIDRPGSAPRVPSPSDDCTLGSSGDDAWLRAVAAAPTSDLAHTDLAPGTVIAQSYEIVRPLGAGAMGVVYEALDRELGRRIALKLHAPRAGARPERVWREARAMARLADPHVVTVHEVGVHDDRLFIAMELVQGGDARRWLARAPRTTPEIIALYRQAARGLAAAHAVGVVHRDFKPDNVLVGDPQGALAADGRVRVADFGLARDVAAVTGASEDDGVTPALAAPDEPATRTGAAMGTPAYMAPELFAGQPADARSDQFAFCVALYEALHGRRPRAGEHGRGSGEHADPNVPRAVQDAITRGLARDPDDRHPDMNAIIAALEPRGRTHAGGWIAAAVVVVGGATAFALLRAQPCEGIEQSATGLWDPARSERVRAAFVATEFPAAGAVADAIAPAIETWATEVGTARREACEATRVHGAQSEARMQLRIDCIDRMQQRAGLVLATFEQADAGVVERASDAVAGLPELSRCADTEALLQAEPVAAADRSEHDALRDRIDALDVERELGHGNRLDAELDEVLALAEAAGYADNLAAIRLLRGRIAFDRIDHARAAIELGLAITAGWRARDLDGTIDAMRVLGTSLSTSPSRLEDALRWIDTAAGLAEASGWSAERRARLDLARADAYTFAGKHAEAEASARAFLAALPEGAVLESAGYNALGNALLFQRRLDEAADAHRRALALAEARRGPQHPEVANRLAALALTLQENGRYEESAAFAQRALKMRESIYGEQSAMVASSLLQIAENLGLRNDMTASLAAYERALAISAALDPPDDELHIRAIGNMIGTLAGAGQAERAAELLRGAMPLAHKVFGADSVRIGELSQTLSTLEGIVGDVHQGVAYGRDAVRLLEKHLGPDDQRVAEACMGLALAYIQAKQYDEALAMLDRVDRIFSAAAQVQPRMLGYAALSRGDALARSGREPEALAASERAVAAFETAYPEGHPELAEALSFRGERLLRAKRPREAEPLLERAAAMLDDPTLATNLRQQIADQLARARRK